jgi:hypothetical protein
MLFSGLAINLRLGLAMQSLKVATWNGNHLTSRISIEALVEAKQVRRENIPPSSAHLSYEGRSISRSVRGLCGFLGFCQSPAVFFFFLLVLVVVPLDGVEHANAQYENFKRKENYREPVDPIPIHHFILSRLLRYLSSITPVGWLLAA